jgi:DNA-binding CsgD family transcriptional regulator
MITPIGQLLCPVLVGREQQMADLRASLVETRAGHAHAVFLCGEAGIGKSRICQAVAEEARSQGSPVLIGHASPQSAALPYEPILDAVRRALRHLSPEHRRELVATLRSVEPVLSPVLPELAYEPARAAAPPPAVADNPALAGLQRRRLFDALLATLQAIGSLYERPSPRGAGVMAPLVVILEDLHWADETSLDFLVHVLHSLGRGAPSLGPVSAEEEPTGSLSTERGLLVIATLRDEALSAAPALVRHIGALVGQRLAHQVDLAPLSAEAHAEMVATTLGQPVDGPIAAALFARSDGNPFFTEELLGALASSGHLRRDGDRWTQPRETTSQHLPLSLRAAVLERLEGLSPAARDVLTTAAVIGRSFEFSLLHAATGMDEDALLAVLRQGVARQLLVEEAATDEAGPRVARSREHAGQGDSTPYLLIEGTPADERFRFRHALTRDAIEGELLARTRRTLHRRIADALESAADLSERSQAQMGEAADRLAYHLLAGGEPARARPYAVAAAGRALGLGAFSEASEHLERAIATAPPGDATRVALLERLGTLRLSLMDMGRGAALLGQARTEAAAAGLRWQAAVIGIDLGYLLWFVDPRRAEEMTAGVAADAAARLQAAEPADADAVRLYAGAALEAATCAGHGDANSEALRLAETALQAAGTLSGAAAHASSTGSTGASTWEDRADAPLIYRALVARGVARCDRGAAEVGLADIRGALELGLRATIPDAVILSYNVLVKTLHELGRDAEALQVCAESEEYERRTGAVVAPPTILYSYLALGRWQPGMEVAHRLVTTYHRLGLPTPEGLALAGLGHLLLAQSRAAEALPPLEAAWSRLEAVEQFMWSAPALWGLAHAHALLGNRDEAADGYRRLYEWWRKTEDRGTAAPILLDGCLFFVDKERSLAEAWAADLAVVAGAGNPVAQAAAAHAAGACHAAAGRAAPAVEQLREAAARWAALQRPYSEAGALHGLGAALLASASHDRAVRAEADALLTRAEASFATLGALRDAGLVGALRRESGLLAQARRRRSLDGAKAPFGGLTPRERDVLRLLATGQTNRAIAARLYITEGTAELHVSRILGKLGAATRAQAAAIAVARGWIDPEDAEQTTP